MTHAFGTIEELGDGYGFRKVRHALGVEAFGVNVIVMPPAYEGFHHYHDEQDELYFVHSGTAKVEVEGEERLLGPGGMVHVSATTPRRVSNGGTEDLVMLVVAHRTSSGGGSFGPARSAAPARANTTTDSQWMPITSVCSASTATATTDAASHCERGTRATKSATSQPTKAATPSSPASTPSSVYVDSPAFGVTPVRDAETPALPSPYPHGCLATVRIPSRSAVRWLDVELSPVENGSSVVAPRAAAFSRRQASSAGVYVVVGPIVGKRATKAIETTTEPAASTAGAHERRSSARTSSAAGSATSPARVCVQSSPA